MKKFDRFTFRLSLEDLKSLNFLADELQRTRSDVVRWLVKEKYSSINAVKKEGSEDLGSNLEKEKTGARYE
jgi:predicted DNA-binding protein